MGSYKACQNKKNIETGPRDFFIPGVFRLKSLKWAVLSKPPDSTLQGKLLQMASEHPGYFGVAPDSFGSKVQ